MSIDDDQKEILPLVDLRGLVKSKGLQVQRASAQTRIDARKDPEGVCVNIADAKVNSGELQS